MKDVPEIAPEIRGLLEEIVANPRSAIRVAPRRALRSWFESDETIRATDVSRERAARHLVEAHREALAALLREASWISYWKDPGLANRPIGADGMPFYPTQHEPDWRSRVEREVRTSSEQSDGLDLLKQCLVGIKPHQGWALAKASLSLAPNDRTRCYLALNVPRSKPKTAIVFFTRLVRRAPASLRPDILLSLGARSCCLGLLADARRFYQASSDMRPQSPYARMCTFNLSCFLGEDKVARAEAEELGSIISHDDPRLIEERDLLRMWVRTRSESEIDEAKKVSERIKDEIPAAARVLCEVFTS